MGYLLSMEIILVMVAWDFWIFDYWLGFNGIYLQEIKVIRVISY